MKEIGNVTKEEGNMMKEERLYLAALQGVEGLGALTIRRLMEALGSSEKVWEASWGTLKKTGLIKRTTMDAFEEYRRHFSLDYFQSRLASEQIGFVTYEEEHYPQLLRSIYNPPAVLFYKGAYGEDQRAISIVGSRKFTNYGKQIAQSFSAYLAERGITIVSGGARGIDTFAHEGALAIDGRTIAVMGCGLDVTYPPENRRLFDKICEKGLIISEYVPGTKPLAQNFPARNRIISGLSQGVIVVEARSASGSLITADMALADGRDVFAVPGNIFSKTSEGAHWLIKQGAIPLFSAEDVLGEYGWFSDREKIEKDGQSSNSVISFTLEEEKVISSLSIDEGTSLETLLQKTKFPLDELNVILLKLEMNHYIEEIDTGGYVLVLRR